MTLHRPPLICNRLEVALLILLCLITSTRLIWLQIDDRELVITDEFYKTALDFKNDQGSQCPYGIDPTFPDAPPSTEHVPSHSAVVSPGLTLTLWGICHHERLTARAFMDYAPIGIGLSAFTVATTSRLLTSNWVGGLLASSVVLSRGSILRGTHVVGTNVMTQSLICLLLGTFCLYARTRDARWLLPLSLLLGATCLAAPILTPIAWLLYVIIFIRTLNHLRKAHFRMPRFRLQLASISLTLLALPILIYSLHRLKPSATLALADFVKFFDFQAPWKIRLSKVLNLCSLAVTELQHQDLHWQASLGWVAIAATWKRYLPRGSGFWALSLLLLSLMGLAVDGFFVENASATIPEAATPLAYKMTTPTSALEPVLIGTAVSYVWFAVRSLLISIFPGYSRPTHGHDRIK